MDLEGQQYDLQEEATYDSVPRSVAVLLSRPRARQLMKRTTARSNTTSRDQLNHTIPYHAMVFFLDPLLVGLLQVEYDQTRPISPFLEHPVNMWSFFIATCLYCLGIIAVKLLKLHRHHYLNSIYGRIIDTLLVITAVVSPLSLALVILHFSAKWVLSILSIVSVVLVGRHYLIAVVCESAYRGWATVKCKAKGFVLPCLMLIILLCDIFHS